MFMYLTDDDELTDIVIRYIVVFCFKCGVTWHGFVCTIWDLDKAKNQVAVLQMTFKVDQSKYIVNSFGLGRLKSPQELFLLYMWYVTSRKSKVT